jgi:hypothetical protein
MFSPPSTCTFFEMPRFAIWQQDTEKFHEVSGDECTSYEELSICGPSLKINDTSCVQKDEISCPQSVKFCTTDKNSRDYVITLSGILIRNNKPLNTFIEQKNGTIKLANLTKYFTTYVPWSKANKVQINEIRIPSPNVPMTEINILNELENFTLPFYSYSNEKLSEEFKRLSEKYNESIGKLIDTTIQDNVVHKNNNLILISVIIAFGIWLILLSIAMFRKIYEMKCSWLCAKFRSCKPCKICRSCGIDSQEEDHYDQISVEEKNIQTECNNNTIRTIG